MRTMKPSNGRSRVIIEEIVPLVDGGRHPLRRTAGDIVTISAAIFGDGHDHVGARLLFRQADETRWRFVPMVAGVNDLWSGSFPVDSIGMWQFAIIGWVDHFDTWISDLRKRLDAQSTSPQDIPLALRSGALQLKDAAGRADVAGARRLLEASRS